MSQTVRSSLADTSEASSREAAASRASASTIHSRLLEEIKLSQQEKTSRLPLRVLMQRQAIVRWAVAAYLFLLTDLGGYSMATPSAACEFPVDSIVSDFDQNLHKSYP